MVRRTMLSLALLGLLLAAATASAQLMDKKTLTLETAKKATAAAEAESAKNNWKHVIAVVDDGGNLVYLGRMDDAPIASVRIAIGKAQTSARFKRPTKAMEDALVGGRNAILALPGATPLEGGLPIVVDGRVVGGIGVSGVTGKEDTQSAQAGVDAVMKALGR